MSLLQICPRLRALAEEAGERKMPLKLIFAFAIKTYRASHHLVSEILH